jgi:predicted Rdx family selenoprotein
MSTTFAVTAVPLPPVSRVSGFYAAPDLADAYAVSLPEQATRDPEVLARFIFARQAPWVARLLWLRDRIMSVFSVKTTDQLQADTGGVRRVAFFRIYAQDADEILLGEDDSHLDFRLAVRCEPASQQLIVTTVVKCHNALGRFYILVIAPFHRLIVRSALRRAARAGWPLKEA